LLIKTGFWAVFLYLEKTSQWFLWFQIPVPLHFVVFGLGMWGASRLNSKVLLVVCKLFACSTILTHCSFLSVCVLYCASSWVFLCFGFCNFAVCMVCPCRLHSVGTYIDLETISLVVNNILPGRRYLSRHEALSYYPESEKNSTCIYRYK